MSLPPDESEGVRQQPLPLDGRGQDERPSPPSDAQLAAWCVEHLGSPPVETTFRTVHLSSVVGFRLRNGREVVVKVRPANQRARECFAIQRHAFDHGYPFPEPLATPGEIDAWLVTAEAYVGGGRVHQGGITNVRQFAAGLHALVDTCRPLCNDFSLEPPLPWLGGWQQHDSLWPPPDDVDADLNEHPGPDWLDSLAHDVSHFLRSVTLPNVIGHGDWHVGNLRGQDEHLHAVFDWDGLARLPEAALAGGASVLYTADARASAGIRDSAAFIEAYEAASGNDWTEEERRVAWAAGLWNLAFDAKKQSLDNLGHSLDTLEREFEERLHHAGL